LTELATPAPVPGPGVVLGERFGSTRVLVGEDLELAVRLTQGTHPVHVSEAAAKCAGLQGRIFHGAVTAAIMAAAIGGRFAQSLIALLEQNNRYLLPVYPGDALRATWTVGRLRESRQAGQWVVELTGQTVNQHGATVLEASAKVLWRGPLVAPAPGT
jgi:3-hydroxybutyryl-CoA dehydratase